jgi:hypothetical protein
VCARELQRMFVSRRKYLILIQDITEFDIMCDDFGVVCASTLFFRLVIEINGTPFADRVLTCGINSGVSPDKEIMMNTSSTLKFFMRPASR